MSHPLNQPLFLPSGATLPNRLAKAAMSEGLADAANHSTPRLETLYRRWANSGVGLLLSGNFQVDGHHLERPNNVVIDDESGRVQLARLAEAGRSGGAHFWVQLSHTGRQVSSEINTAPLSPSDVDVDVTRDAGLDFARPKPMTVSEIQHAIEQFAFAAVEVQRAGFTGVSLHAAHGYLISQFLSPLSNRRDDEWGGALTNRARFLIHVIAAVRRAVGPQFPMGIKLNASDFQRGGFTNAECVELVQMLDGVGLDLLELSGGSLEQPKVVGVALKDEGEDGRRVSTVAREGYFVAFAGAVRKVASMPVMVTGGFRTVAGMVDALASGDLDVVGLGRPLIADRSAVRRLLAGEIDRLPTPALDVLHIQPWHNMQLERLGDGLDPDLALTGEAAAVAFTELEAAKMGALLAHRAQRSRGDAA
ncbi:NADH:flavin oxidoreductase/NADH oxidase family protein [Mycolicibacterium sp. CH28]|uniref:NADH:flavin oxidoreductase/NADH oxidase family protein n=1 Tax=Mycolicibacterium sp. CH28 TaxID=2512237 RepID=UPI0010800F43|nr:NADH:flavin oxidoreductase/NADH oxidase family protein [Mycolicibacterium sp. CH28]TGD85490.1 NADH:flavin oxidoreductase/NADH oxidase family protein [Mycolicibacterium sp. CH28]